MEEGAALVLDSDEDKVEEWSEDEEDEQCITAEDVQLGVRQDVQGIAWTRLQYTRQEFRNARFQKYVDHMNRADDVIESQAALRREGKHVARDGLFYRFCRNLQRVGSTIEHFQLRNLVWATSTHDVYLVHGAGVKHWNDAARRATKVLDLSGAPQDAGHAGRVRVTTSCVRGNLVAAGGMNGELAVANLENGPGPAFSSRITVAENSITNGIEIFEAASGATRVMTSNNDACLRLFDAATFMCCSRHMFAWPVNYASMQPGGSVMAVVGDDPDTLLLDDASGGVVATLRGHLDFSFAVAWHPSRPLLATGNQDTTTRVWDTRMLGKGSLALLRGSMGAVRSLRFSPDGRFLAAAESVDFVQLCQEIDLFGEIGGMAFTPGSEALFVALSEIDHSEVPYTSLLQYRREEASEHPRWAAR